MSGLLYFAILKENNGKAQCFPRKMAFCFENCSSVSKNLSTYRFIRTIFETEHLLLESIYH